MNMVQIWYKKMDNKTMYLFGRIYARLCFCFYGSFVDVPASVLTMADRRPFLHISLMQQRLYVSHKLTDDLDKFLIYRFDDVGLSDIGDFDYCDPGFRFSFTIGYQDCQNEYGFGGASNLIYKTGLTYSEIADRLSVAVNTVWRWSNDVTPLSELNRYKLEKLVIEKNYG